jgi:hypothetical protein
LLDPRALIDKGPIARPAIGANFSILHSLRKKGKSSLSVSDFPYKKAAWLNGCNVGGSSSVILVH